MQLNQYSDGRGGGGEGSLSLLHFTWFRRTLMKNRIGSEALDQSLAVEGGGFGGWPL